MQLDGAKVVLTGTFQGRSREEVEKLLEAKGAVITTRISMDTEVVFSGEEPGVEVDDAREIGIRVMSQARMEALLSGEGAPARERVSDEMYAGYIPATPDVDVPEYVAFEEIDGVLESAPPAPGSSPGKKPKKKAKKSDDDRSALGDGGARVFEKGDTVKIIGGLEGVGHVGEIFWWGESKFGEGMRAGVSGPEDTSYWVDEEHLGWPDEEVDDEVLELAKSASQFKRGDAVRVISGKDSGASGTIFWWGESKFGEGMRAGVECDDGSKVWVDAEHMEQDGDGGGGGDMEPIPDDVIPF